MESASKTPQNTLYDTITSVLTEMKANKENIAGAQALYSHLQSLFSGDDKNECFTNWDEI